jgi:uncharacterized phage protein (TIGR02218 family)
MSVPQELNNRLLTGVTTLCRAWRVDRRDGTVLGFTDHDRDLAFEGVTYRAQSGMTARALSQTSGLAVDNSEAIGALSDAGISEADIEAGRYDGAALRIWLVDWSNPDLRVLQFQGSLGLITRRDGLFEAELRGLTEFLNQPQGQVYQRPCAAILGDARCRFDLSRAGYTTEQVVGRHEEGRRFWFDGVTDFEPRWFEHGRIKVQSGISAGLIGIVKNDRFEDGQRMIELWEPLRGEIATGDQLLIEAGCDRRAETCRAKFGNFLNYRGFPHIPGEDWLISYPVQGGANTGGSMNS